MNSQYNMKFSVGDISRILEVEKDIIKKWAYLFSNYLSSPANPPKGITREFCREDLRVMAYVFTYWEDDPDIEYIKIGLNSNSHHDNELIDNFIIEVKPVFMDVPDDIDETWKHGVLFCGLAEFGDRFFLANSYKLAGDRLIDMALENEEVWELFCPAVYNYRHATELYLKEITGDTIKMHGLDRLYNKLEKYLKDEFDTKIPIWFRNLVTTFNDFDSDGTTFRYGGSLSRDEVFIDFIQLKKLMGWLAQSFQNIRQRQGMPDSTL